MGLKNNGLQCYKYDLLGRKYLYDIGVLPSKLAISIHQIILSEILEICHQKVHHFIISSFHNIIDDTGLLPMSSKRPSKYY